MISSLQLGIFFKFLGKTAANVDKVPIEGEREQL